MCDLQTHLEREDYAVGFTVLPACSVGAPHKRDRLFFGATLAYTDSERLQGERRDSDSQGRAGVSERADQQSAGAGSVESWLAESLRAEWYGERLQGPRKSNQTQEIGAAAELTGCGNPGGSANPHHGFWSDADWLGCRDGKFRPVEPGTSPLANGIPARVGRLRGYGNAVVPQVAAEFVKAFMSCEAP